MKYRYTKFTGDILDDLDLEDLVSKLSDLLLSSGFGNPYAMDEADRTMQAVHDAILDALFNGGVLPEETIERLLGESEEGDQSDARQRLEELIEANVPEMTTLVSSAGGGGGFMGGTSSSVNVNVKLKPREPVLYFVQRLRDEAHRFAVGSHRMRRRRDIREAGLQEIPGVGPTRKRALLHHFGTLKAIERAAPADLAKVPGISAETARKIYDFFHAQAG